MHSMPPGQLTWTHQLRAGSFHTASIDKHGTISFGEMDVVGRGAVFIVASLELGLGRVYLCIASGSTGWIAGANLAGDRS